MRPRSRHLLLPLLSLALLCLQSTGAGASVFRARPISIELKGTDHVGSMVVTNRSTAATRYQVRAAQWAESPSGEMLLTATDEVVAEPAQFTLAPGASSTIRIASTVAPAALERTYRVFVDELPPVTPAGSASDEPAAPAHRPPTRLGVPVFVSPTTVSTSGDVVAALADGVLVVEVHNHGSRRVRPSAIRVIGKQAGGAVVLDRQEPGWDLLAGGVRRFVMRLRLDECLPLDHLRVEVTVDGTTWTTTVPVATPACRNAT